MTFKKRTDKSSPELSKRILVYVPAMQFIVNEGLKRLSIYIYIYTYIRWGLISRHALPMVSFDFIILYFQVSNAGCHVAGGGQRSSFMQLYVVSCCQSS